MPIEINEDLIKQWEPKIHRMLATTSVRGYSKEDLEQELRISILKAAKGFNEDKSIQKTLRKPEEQLKEFSDSGPKKVLEFYDAIKTMGIKLNGRINAEVLLLRAVML